jgi:uncharacterized repeat protein (TIGR01451 family)
MQRISLGALAKRHHIGLSLFGIVAACAVILPACGGGGSTDIIAPPAPAPDLSIAKVGVVSGNTVTYTITVTNNGTVPATGPIVVQDSLPSAPAGVQFAGASGTCSGGLAGPIVCTSSSALAAGGQLAITVALTVPASGGTVTNCASVTQGLVAGTPAETNVANNRACATNTVTATVSPPPDLSITKVGVVSGNTVTYTITVTNNGTVPTPGSIVMQDSLPLVPAGLQFSSTGGTCSGFGAVPCLWSYSTPLAPGAQLTYTVTVVVPVSGGTVTNCASVAQGLNVGTPAEANLANNRACTTNTVPPPQTSPDMSITKVGVVSGNTVTYTITATNNGTVSAPGPIVMQDSLPSTPAGVQFSGATGSSGTCTGVGAGPIVCTSSSALAAGAQVTYTVTLTAPASGGTVINCASVKRGSDAVIPDETNLANNRACATNSVVAAAPAPDLSITKVGVVSGNTVTYTIIATNNGAVSAPGPIVMQDSLPSTPAGVQFSGATGSIGTCTGVGAGPIVCTSGSSLAAGGQLTYTLTLTVPSGGAGGPGGGTVTNCASVTQASNVATPGETNLANNRACATNTVTPPTGTLTIVKHAQSFDPQVFHFATTGGGGLVGFNLDDNGNNADTLSNSRTFTLPAGGPYTVTETAVTGWAVSVINCTQTGAQNSNVTGNVPGITVTLGSGGNVICTFENVRVALGTIVVNATLAGAGGSSPWTGAVSYTLTGPQTISGTSAPQTFASVSVGSYTLTYVSGGPSGATLNSVTSSATQTVTGGGTTTFTLNFR